MFVPELGGEEREFVLELEPEEWEEWWIVAIILGEQERCIWYFLNIGNTIFGIGCGFAGGEVVGREE